MGMEVILNPFIGKEIDEVTPKSLKPWNLRELMNPKNWLSIPYNGIHHIFSAIANKRYGIHVEGTKNETISAHSVDISRINLAQVLFSLCQLSGR